MTPVSFSSLGLCPWRAYIVTQSLESGMVGCGEGILCYRSVQLILAYSWARSVILVAGKSRGGMFYYAPRRISGEHIVAASSVRPCVRVSVRPCVRPALVHANSRKLLVGFQWNFMGILSIKGGCAYHLRVLVRWFFQELLPFDEFCMNI